MGMYDLKVRICSQERYKRQHDSNGKSWNSIHFNNLSQKIISAVPKIKTGWTTRERTASLLIHPSSPRFSKLPSVTREYFGLLLHSG
jgi:hypothetical protein